MNAHPQSRIMFLALLLPLAAAAELAESRGRLDPAPALGTRSAVRLVPALPETLARFPAPPAEGERVWEPSRAVQVKGTTYTVAVGASGDGSVSLWLDRDRDGRFGSGERWMLAGPERRVELTLPWDNGIYREFPIEFAVQPTRQAADGEAGTSGPFEAGMMSYNFNIVFGATLDLGGRPLRITFAPRPADSSINLATTRVTMDTNFNGRIEHDRGESVNPSGRPALFRIDDRYWTVASADVKTGEVVLQERPASEFTRFDALPGQEMPDFTFTTFEGKTHKLSDFRGKHVLLDFWGTWCGPCISEMKHLDPLYAKYRGRGFEVIGLNIEKTDGRKTDEVYAKDEEKVRAFLAKAGHQWLQATQRSIERFALDVIQVNSYPTCILVGPDGRVISREARGKVLEELLAKHLPGV